MKYGVDCALGPTDSHGVHRYDLALPSPSSGDPRLDHEASIQPDHGPAWSVLIPAYNRPQRLQGCLDALAQLAAPEGGFEVVVVDDGSEPALQEQVEPPAGLALRILRQDNAGPATARNYAAKAARGDWLAFTDDDCHPHPGWLTSFQAAINGDESVLAGGHTVNALTDCAPAAASQLLLNYLHEYFNDRQGGATFFPSNNYGMSKSAFEQIGGFDESFPLAAAEDRDFCDRAIEAGVRLVFAPEAGIDHYHGMNLRGFWKQHFNYGRGAYAYHRLRAERQADAVGCEPLRFYVSLVRYPLAKFGLLRGAKLSLLMAISQVANVAGYLRQRWLGRD